MRIFVTGGSGFIGRHTVAELRERGHRLMVLSRKAGAERGVKFVKGDLSDTAGLRRRLKKFKPEAAVHLAWEGIPDFSYERCLKNLTDGLGLFSVLAEVGCRKIVATGRVWEYGNLVGKVREDAEVIPTSAFMAAKHAVHRMGEALAKEKGMDFIWLRLFNVYGPGQREGSLIPYIMRTIAGAEPLRLKNPLAQGDFVYVTDVAKAIGDAVARGKGRSVYNITFGEPIRVRDIAKLVCDDMGASEEYYRAFASTAKGASSPTPYADVAAARKELGWRPTVAIKEGVKKTVSAYKQDIKKS